MKKSKLKIGLVTSFICGMALTACDVTKNKDYVVQYKDYSGSELGLLTETMYGDYLDTDAGLTKYYEKVRDLLILSTFKDITAENATDGLKVKTQLSTLEAQAENKVEEQKETARKNAKNNDTSYSDEMDTIYESYGCEDTEEEGLYNHFLLELEKEQLEDAILDNTEQLKDLRSKWLDNAKPYHIKHMLVKVEGGSTDFVRATISEDEATKLSKIVTLLAGGNKFDDLAANNLLNDDSSDKLGDVGIVNNNATSKSLKMVSEFQLGIYAADIMINGKTAEKIGTDKEIELGKSGYASTKVSDLLAGNFKYDEIPYSVFTKLGTDAKYPESTEDEKVKNVSEHVYPRNVIWNKYLNNHNIFVITNDSQTYAEGKSGFKSVTLGGTTKNLLCAEDGKVVFGVRSEYGIHFIKIQKSAFEAKTDLEKYYPISLNENDETDTYLTGLDSTKDTQDSRLSDIKSAIKSFDSSVEYNLYNKLVSFATSSGKINNAGNTKEVLDKIQAHIEDLKDNESYKQEEGIKVVWENYLRLIELQDSSKSATWDESYYYTTYESGVGKAQYKSLSRPAVIDSNVSGEPTADAFKALCLAAEGNAKTTALAQFLEGGTYYYAK